MARMRTYFAFLIILIVSFSSDILFAQKDVKLGLVLSGGGAKGIAHIGVLKAMEQAGLRPDYITGTSMGSIVGGLYSLGYSADQIEEIVREIDWNQILSNNVPLNYISFEEKEYYNRYLAEFPLDGLKLRLPSGLIEGQILTETLERYCWPANQYESFDEFPIPFRCMATDVKTAESVVMKDGSLAMAIRSSMALPTAFTAVPYEETLLVDGGVLNNFPVEEVISMGADIVIGVNVSTGIDNTTMPESMLGILVNLATIPADKRVYDQIELCDVYIQPDLGPYSTASFSSYEEILQIGDSTGQAFLGELEQIARRLDRPYKEPQLPELNEVYIEKINLSGNKLFSDKLIKSKLGVSRDSIVDQKDIEEGVKRVYSINGFAKVNYGLSPGMNDHYELNLDMYEKRRSRLFASVHVDNVFAAGIVLNYTSRDLILKESRTIIAGDISKNPAFRLDYYKYFGEHKKLALNLRYDYRSDEFPIYEKGREIDLRIDNFHRVGLNVLTTQSLKQSFFAGFSYEYRTIKSKFAVGLPAEIKTVTEEHWLGDFGYTYNTLNDRNFATSGSEIFIVASAIFDNNFRANLTDEFSDLQSTINDTVRSLTPGFYGQFFLQAEKFIPIAEKTQFIPFAASGLTIAVEETGTFIRPFRLGGYQRRLVDDIRAYGLNFAEIQETNVGLFGVQIQRVIGDNIFFKVGGNMYSYYPFIAIDDLGDLDAELLGDNTAFGYGAELSLRSPIGPISGGISTNTRDGYMRYYFALGFSFNYSD